MADVNSEVFSVVIDTDPGADQVVPLFRARKACTLTAAYFFMTDAVAAHADNHISLALMNGGLVGTATTAMSGTVGGTVGWTALKPEVSAVSAGTLAAGEVVVLNYNEEGTVTCGIPMVVQLEVEY